MRQIVDRYAPKDVIYLLNESRMLWDPRDPLYWALHPDPLIHSWRWLQKDKPVTHVWVEDSWDPTWGRVRG